MKTLVAPLALLCCLAASVAAQPQSVVDQFEERSLTFEGFTLEYRLFVPEGYEPTTMYPLVLTLHGAGERGDNNESQIALHRVATTWADPANQVKDPTFVVSPRYRRTSGGRPSSPLTSRTSPPLNSRRSPSSTRSPSSSTSTRIASTSRASRWAGTGRGA